MTTSGILRLATRGSPLALWQARRVVALLAKAGIAAEPIVVETEGDRRTDVPLSELGGQGVFVTEVQRAVVAGRADAAVHSAKDLPASDDVVNGGELTLAAFPERADPRDVLVGARLDGLAVGATVATGSARRRVQLAHLRPDLHFVDLRGNLGTRLARAGTDGVSAVVAARAALDRLEWVAPPGIVVETLDPDAMLPQVAQGALAVECRADDGATMAALASIDDLGVRAVVEAERGFLAELGGGCSLPVGAHADPVGPVPGPGTPPSRLRLTGLVASEDGRVLLRRSDTSADGPGLGQSVARELIEEARRCGVGPWAGDSCR